MKAATRPTHRDVEVIRDYILLPHMMTMIESSRLAIVNSNNPMRDLMGRFLNAMLDIINADLVNIRIAMSRGNIKVWEDVHAGDVLYYRYRCRGYEERFGMIREVMRAEISVRLAKYGSQLLKEKQDPKLPEIHSDQPVVH
jgi:hypothetical protein